MRDKDELLGLAEVLCRDLTLEVHRLTANRSRTGDRAQAEVDDNLLRKVTQYYVNARRSEGPGALDRLLDFLARNPPKHGKGLLVNWEACRNVIRRQEKTFRGLSPGEVAYVLGWTSRLARADAGRAAR